ncbi:decarboxylating 6-phosphogluconate dehydrogenase [Mycobacterium koreense]|uniref:6-phosphogluconate dehydrogenase (Decarboxylating) n=1 Tax=Mycolicibacillus koreensis TaxID=1069220 RepID=A0AA91PBD0_9MYCO|nr:decarboxylating 6-phosphogluconate dehydrogenase [Mycolicibacillus koreensis]MCV7249542.1 decarboxylating 6-phosphogluconate dehydrogenase [Mycolicibacillus koreensis]ODR04094.1 6-phosphogluconate dehydrogenase (decarboxylating) [Mycolicibacillus koreensis]OSC25742.1 6-phosphogluconate dehydrogenase (decarboxylating) [Mycolicibacillus koreensis]
MQLGMIGLGRMGANLVRRVLCAGHDCVVYDRDTVAVETLVSAGAVGTESIAELASKLVAPRVVWVMVPAGVITHSVIAELAGLLEGGDIVIDGGNSYYRDAVRHAEELAGKGIRMLDCGTSGGVWGLARGFSLMIGGDRSAYAAAEPIFEALAPGVLAAERTKGRDGEVAPEEKGYLHCGPSGAGHFVKMVHNGIEYGMMAAVSEGLNILHRADIGVTETVSEDAETAPMTHPEFYRYVLDLPAIAEVWRRGSVIGSWLVDLTAAALVESPDLSAFEGWVSDSGEGRWTAIAAIEEGVPAPVITAALGSRFASRNLNEFADKAVAAMRKKFGGHDEKPGATR